jgi:cation diffusion facilitator family transporter
MEKTERAAVISGIAAAVFAAFLLYVAVFWHSVAFFAGAMLTVSRSVTGFLVAATLRLSKKRTVSFSSGLYKLENLIVTIIGFLIIFGAYELGRLVLFRMRAGEPVMGWSDMGILALLIATVMGLVLGIFKDKIGKKENCPSLRADARHSFIDAAAMFVIASGVSLAALGLPFADYVAALLVALVVCWNGGRIAIDGIRVLLDASVETDLLEEVGRIARSDPRIRNVVETGGRNSGSRRFFALKLVPLQHDIHVTAAITKDLKEKIRHAISNTDEVSIEYVTEADGTQNLAIPLDGEGRYSSSGLSGAPGLAIVNTDMISRKTIRRRTIANPYTGKDLRDGIRTAVMLARQGIDAVILPGPPDEKDVRYTLEAYGIHLLFAPAAGGRDDMQAVLRDATEGPVDVEGGRR